MKDESMEREHAVSEQLTLSDLKMWSFKTLKTFLSLRNRSVTGLIDVLAARLEIIS